MEQHEFPSCVGRQTHGVWKRRLRQRREIRRPKNPAILRSLQLPLHGWSHRLSFPEDHSDGGSLFSAARTLCRAPGSRPEKFGYDGQGQGDWAGGRVDAENSWFSLVSTARSSPSNCETVASSRTRGVSRSVTSTPVTIAVTTRMPPIIRSRIVPTFRVREMGGDPPPPGRRHRTSSARTNPSPQSPWPRGTGPGPGRPSADSWRHFSLHTDTTAARTFSGIHTLLPHRSLSWPALTAASSGRR
jgi:hypothetical protein